MLSFVSLSIRNGLLKNALREGLRTASDVERREIIDIVLPTLSVVEKDSVLPSLSSPRVQFGTLQKRPITDDLGDQQLLQYLSATELSYLVACSTKIVPSIMPESQGFMLLCYTHRTLNEHWLCSCTCTSH
mmetsp:Transcript_19387/g.31766  ORF Transcript_19387/g.31766 Transcript_19387/m.31766 type:complete len:131 (+) Transcript_19387:606-998(+)